jgi:hypothetical protein
VIDMTERLTAPTDIEVWAVHFWVGIVPGGRNRPESAGTTARIAPSNDHDADTQTTVLNELFSWNGGWAAITVDGRVARELVTDGRAAGCAGVSGTTVEVDAAVQLDLPNHMWQMRACIAGPNTQQAATTALAMFHSAHFDPSVWK